jgi:hypothetical protein
VPVDLLAQRYVLAREVVVLVVQLGRHGEADLDAVGSERPHLRDLELVEAGPPVRPWLGGHSLLAQLSAP